jgi:hypothetical protein
MRSLLCSFVRSGLVAESLVALWLAAGVGFGCGGGDNVSAGDGGGGGITGWDGGGVPDASIAGPDSGSGQEIALFSMSSLQGISRNPPVATVFTLTQAAYVTRVLTYHYAATIAGKSAAVAFKDTTTGAVYGPWPQIGYTSFAGTLGATRSDPGNVPGPPDNYWMAYPGQSVPAGTYQVIDSDPATWCHTADTGNRGITWVYGWYGDPPIGPSNDGGSADDGGSAIDTRPRPVLIGPVTSATVAPSSSSTTTPLGTGVAITVSGGFLPASTTFTSAPVLQLPRDIAGPTQMLGAFELTCSGCPSVAVDGGADHRVDAGAVDGGGSTGPMTIELSYDPTLLDPGLEEGKGIFVATWDIEGQGWVMVPFQVDTVRKKLLVPTDHLSTWVYWTLRGYKSVTTAEGHFDVYYNPSHTVPLVGTTGMDMRGFAGRVGELMEIAYGRYKTAGFKMPWYLFTTATKVVVTDDTNWFWDSSEKAPSYSKDSGNIFLKRSNLTSEDKIRGDGAHELFHAIQNQYTNVLIMNFGALWWYEGTPDYAAYAVAWEKAVPLTPSFIEPTSRNYFAIPLTAKDGDHAYQMARFLNYLNEKHAIDFKSLWDFVMSKSDPLSGFEIYVGEHSNTTFSSAWRNFVAWMCFDPAANYTDAEFTLKALPGPTAPFTYAFPTLPASYSVAGLKLATGKPPLNLTVETAVDLPGDVVLEIWQQPKVAGTTTLLGVLAGSTRSQTITTNASDVIYVLAMNTGRNARDVSVTVTAAAVAVVPPPVAKTYTMTYKLENSPPSTCSGACGDISTPTTGVTGTLSTANGSATLTSSYAKTDKLGDAVSCSVNATGTWDATRMALNLTGSFSCAAATHKETGTFSSQSEWTDMGNGYLQLLSTPTWIATFASSDVATPICGTTCTGDVLFKPSRLTP